MASISAGLPLTAMKKDEPSPLGDLAAGFFCEQGVLLEGQKREAAEFHCDDLHGLSSVEDPARS
jgi:hypothetical protein